MVRVPYCRARSASAITCLISLMPASTAENSMKSAWVMRAMILASVVLPTPGGPQKMQRAGVVALDLHAQRLARPQDVLLPDKLVERARTHAIGQRTRLVDGFVGRDLLEEIQDLFHHGGHGEHGDIKELFEYSMPQYRTLKFIKSPTRRPLNRK